MSITSRKKINSDYINDLVAGWKEEQDNDFFIQPEDIWDDNSDKFTAAPFHISFKDKYGKEYVIPCDTFTGTVRFFKEMKGTFTDFTNSSQFTAFPTL